MLAKLSEPLMDSGGKRHTRSLTCERDQSGKVFAEAAGINDEREVSRRGVDTLGVEIMDCAGRLCFVLA